MTYELSEAQRALAGLIRFGVVMEVDVAASRVRVRTGGLESDWLPWLTARAGKTRTWSAPTVGEQGLVLSPGGDPAQGVFLAGLYQDAHPAPAASADHEHISYPDGSSVDYDSASNTLTVNVAAAGNVIVNCQQATVNAAASVLLDTPQTTCTGALTVQGLLTYQAGMAGSGGVGAAAVIQGSIQVTGGDIQADTISLKGHGHMEQGDGARVGNAVP
jgi:phage baseplate assembly protein V